MFLLSPLSLLFEEHKTRKQCKTRWPYAEISCAMTYAYFVTRYFDSPHFDAGIFIIAVLAFRLIPYGDFVSSRLFSRLFGYR